MNQEHVAIVRLGNEDIYAWRRAHPNARLNLIRADMIEADLSGADLSRANLVEANLFRANLSEANLGGANLNWANLIEADLTRAHLPGANLARAHLAFTAFNGADLNQARFSEATLYRTVFADCDLSAGLGLESVVHNGPSSIGLDTIVRSGGNIPEAFLRGAGVPDSIITYVHSLVLEPRQFYTCFISYASPDQDFAQKLYNDLQAKGVRCWFAPEDMKIGDRIRPVIDRAIRVRDKLLLVLSEHSIGSQWVETEVETALEEERRYNKTVLFPIRLDDAVMETDQAWAANIRRTRHIGDFRWWKEHDAYQRSFDHLLRDLAAKSLPAVE
jgi:hypothetical protein